MTQFLHSTSDSIHRFRKALLLSSILGSLLMGMPLTASAHDDPGQPSVPAHLMGYSMCNGGLMYGTIGGVAYPTDTGPRQVVAQFPLQIMGATSDPNEWAGWTAVLYKYDFAKRQWNVVETKPFMWVHTPHIYGYPGSLSETFGTPGVPLDAGWYVVRNWIFWYSTGTYHYEDGQLLNCT